MPSYIIKLTDEKDNKDYYMEWSTIVDAPTTYGVDLDKFKENYKDEYGKSGMGELDQRLDRIAKHGTSARDGTTVRELISCNRAGENEECLTEEEILDKYCR